MFTKYFYLARVSLFPILQASTLYHLPVYFLHSLFFWTWRYKVHLLSVGHFRKKGHHVSPSISIYWVGLTKYPPLEVFLPFPPALGIYISSPAGFPSYSISCWYQYQKVYVCLCVCVSNSYFIRAPFIPEIFLWDFRHVASVPLSLIVHISSSPSPSLLAAAKASIHQTGMIIWETWVMPNGGLLMPVHKVGCSCIAHLCYMAKSLFEPWVSLQSWCWNPLSY